MTDRTNIIPNANPIGLPYGPGMSQKGQMMPSGPLSSHVRGNSPLTSHAQPVVPSYSPSAPSVNGMNGPVVPPLRPVYAPPPANRANITTSLPNAMREQQQQSPNFQRFPLPGPYPTGEISSAPGFTGPSNVLPARQLDSLPGTSTRPVDPSYAGMSPNAYLMRPPVSLAQFRAPVVNSIHPVPPGQFQGPVPPVSGPIPPRGPPPSTGYMPPGPPVALAQPIGPPPAAAPIAPGTVLPPSDRPTELPVPYHGHGQYSHQVGATMKLTPGITPNTSEPPSQKSSRSSTPLGSGSYDALEGQFTPNAQSPNQFRPEKAGPPFPGHNFPQAGQYGSPVSLLSGPPTSSSQPLHPGSLPPLPGQARQPPMSGPPPLNNTNVYPSNTPPQPPSHIGPPGPPNFITPHPPPPHGPNAPSSVDALTGPPIPGVGGAQIKQQYENMSMSPGSIPPPMGGTRLASAAPQTGYPPPTGPMTNAPMSMAPQPMYGQPQGANTFGSVSAGLGNITLQDTSMTVDLLQQRSLIPPTGMETPRVSLPHDYKGANCNPHVFRCTLNAIPQTSGLLNKARLPLGIIIHPFKDLSQLPVIQSSVIVRCRSCRTYINPFVHFADTRRWKCNLCYRINELPDEFSYDPVSKSHGDPQRRPEIRSATIEFIAPSEYMLRPPQPAVYVYLLDVSFNAVETGYLSVFCETLLEELDKLPGDARTQVGFIAYDKALHFFNLSEGLSQPQMLIVSDIEDIFLPCPDNLLVNLHESRQLIIDLLTQLPGMFEENKVTGSAMGSALQAAYKLMSSTGGRVTVMQTCLPTVGPGALTAREDPNMRSGKNITNLGPATDFYKKLALDCSAQQVAVDLFMFNGQYADVASLGCIAKYSAGCIYYYPSFHSLGNVPLRDKFETDLHRYLTRKIGFEAVMRIRCTKGLSIHTFHGNFFVRSTDLLSLPNINPDAGFGMQMSIEENLGDLPNVCFQAALLYTSSKGERRIRVHTLCIPVTNQLNEVFVHADQQAIISLLAKMAVDRSVTSSMSDARDALVNAALDAVTAYGNTLPSSQRIGTMPCPFPLRLIPLFVLSLMKSVGFRTGSSTKLDDRVIALEQCKTLPVKYLLQLIYPCLYPVHELTDENGIVREDVTIPQPPLLQLSSSQISRQGAFLMDTGEAVTILVGSAVPSQWCQDALGVSEFSALPDSMMELPELDNPTSERLRLYLSYLLDQRPNGTTLLIIRDDSKQRHLFFQHMIEDRTESAMSYYEFLQHIQKQLKS